MLHQVREIGKKRAGKLAPTRYVSALFLHARTSVWCRLATRLKRLVDSKGWVAALRLTALKTLIMMMTVFSGIQRSCWTKWYSLPLAQEVDLFWEAMCRGKDLHCSLNNAMLHSYFNGVMVVLSSFVARSVFCLLPSCSVGVSTCFSSFT